jgi:hypothetical protein
MRTALTETLRQGKGFVPREKLALLDVDVRVGKFGDRSHVVKMRVGDKNRVDRVCVHADLGQHPQRRDPGRDPEFP